MSLIHLVIIGALSVVAGTCLVFASYLGTRSGNGAAFHLPQHRADDGTGGGNVLAPAPVEVIRIRPIDNATLDEWVSSQNQERTEEMPLLAVAEPVEHVEVTEEQGLDGYAAPEPSAELAEPTEAERRMADLHDEALWDNERRDAGRSLDRAFAAFRQSEVTSTVDQWLREAGELPGRAEARWASSETVLEHTGEIPRAELAELLAAGAR